MQPSTENLTRLLAARIASALAPHGASLHSLAVWELPTEAVTVAVNSLHIPAAPAGGQPDK